MMTKWFTVIVTSGLVLTGCSAPLTQPEEQVLKPFIDQHVATVAPLAKEAALAYWEAATTGQSEAYARAGELDLQLKQVYSDPDDFALLQSLRDSGQVTDPLLSRQMDLLINAYLPNQIEPDLLKQMVDLSTSLEEDFSTFRATINGEKVTDNQIKDILKGQKDLVQRQKAWLASKQVGAVVADDIVRLVKLRNQAAQQLGYENYHTLSLTTAEQDVAVIDQLFDELYELTRGPFEQCKRELDALLSQQLGVPADQLRPWHYHDPFFQETPMVYDLDLDVYYQDKDVKQLAQTYYHGLGLDVRDILQRSDLYEREGKNPHAFCTDIDREGDIRALCNLQNNETWMETMLHELGHGLYDKHLDADMPYLLREPAHIFTTEAIAMLFGRFSRNPAWMQEMLDLSDAQRAEIEPVAAKYAQLKQLIFARWAMVMFRFEQQLYADPDQDLNVLWWDLVEKYQLVRRPEGRDAPDWAAKIHFVIAPCYYHNYLLGELFASQLNHTLVTKVLGLPADAVTGYVGHPEVGQYLIDHVFAPGSRDSWNTMIEKATGEPLTARYFVEQFVKP